MSIARSCPRTLALSSLLVWVFALAGCGRAKLPAPNEVIEPVVRVNELPWHLKAAPAKEGEEAPPWHQMLSVELEALPGDAAGLREAIDQRRGDAYQAAQALLKEIATGVEAGRKPDALWSVLSIQIGGHKPQRNTPPTLAVELGLTKLYARRPTISFQDVTFEQCMTNLALQGGLKLAPNRSVNPVLSWQKENVSVIEAIDAILNLHGFDRRITGAYVQTNLQTTQFKTRQEFVEAAVQATLNYGKGLDRNIAALILSLRGLPAERSPSDTGTKKKGGTVKPPPPVDDTGVPAKTTPESKTEAKSEGEANAK